jgi:phage gpG-like protein
MAEQTRFGPPVRRVFETFSDISDIYSDIAEIIDASIQENFEVGGRYGSDNEMGGGSNHWNPSGRARREGGQTLVKDSHLRTDVQVEPTADGIRIGTQREYGAIHHFGGTIKHPGGTPYANIGGIPTFMKKDGEYPPGTRFTKAHDIPIEARPWAVVQDEDLEDINLVVVEYVEGRI